jgi:fatty acid desaturase
MLTWSPTTEELAKQRKSYRTFAVIFLFLAIIWVLLGAASIIFHRGDPWFRYAELGFGFAWVFMSWVYHNRANAIV